MKEMELFHLAENINFFKISDKDGKQKALAFPSSQNKKELSSVIQRSFISELGACDDKEFIRSRGNSSNEAIPGSTNFGTIMQASEAKRYLAMVNSSHY